MRINHLKVGLLFEDKDAAVQFVVDNVPDAVVKINTKNALICETSILYFEWIKPSANIKGKKLNFIFTTKDIHNTDWFNSVVWPMLITGVGIIDE